MFNAVLRWIAPGRRAASDFHCTTKAAVFPVVLAGLLVVALASTPEAAFARPTSSNTWQAMFDLQPGVTYTYTLTYETTGHGSGFSSGPGYGPGSGHAPGSAQAQGPGHGLSPGKAPGPGYGPGASAGAGFGPGRGGRGPIRGELNLWRSGGSSDEIRFWFTIDDVRINGTAPVDPQAVAGAVLVAALTSPTPISYEGIRLLTTVFQWTQWRDLFAESSFRHGLVWEVLQHPPHRFTAKQSGFFGPFHGQVTRGRDTVLELTIDLAKPLPLEIVAFDGRDRYTAELVQAPVRGPRR